ncbi:MAG: long-chain-acyl-CoA synthetase [Pseudomonadales bacterium]|nr:long-chain-acyl-CoA synthetase [Pseudomonadales bacterium]MAQ26626.1 long-chain-acyl-CoA synthetase [Pseudomonadales bacterium]MBI26359.1 long-chain-acyl-CoA synthetase [Pseudomonadales bacterium]HAU15275.1 long-chain-acyl-CoA synthetase [Gammaproteobacteria bacterium]HCB39436.1 long-chain-acyl-CoA synthetase [Gammaproteobacteria bacterium]|tara:strand:+ start:11445 stop:13238 length:1794 start_codon:yes stop_codon:yes gene_type:complete
MGAVTDVLTMLGVIRKALKLKPLPGDTPLSLGSMVAQRAQQSPDNVMVVFEGVTLTWGQFNTKANQMAHYLKSQGVKKGDAVALLMENRIENLACVTALAKIGAVAAMINTSLTEAPLLHCIKSVASVKVIVGQELLSPLSEIRSELGLASNDIFWVQDAALSGAGVAPEWAVALDFEGQPGTDLPQTAEVTLSDLAYYIFTSGTTGLPKASRITHDRHYRMSLGFSSILLNMSEQDRIYACLPLYHSSGMFICFGSIIHSGGSMFLRRKFSASNLLREARQHQTTCFAYIGELCRYLLHQAPQPDDADNPIRKCVGNGLRPDIWMEFKTRFGIERVGEFYGASEGNAGCVNAFNKDCTVGFCGARHALVRYDVLNDELLRSRKGFCQKVKKGEAGLMLMEISKDAVFDGYVDPGATQKKILTDVFKKGDRYFNSGDLLKQVDVGFALGLPHYQFVDRVGDTYRWKGENVSTNEIGEIINGADSVAYCNVYGVQLPGTDGRAGMVAISAKHGSLQLPAISQHIIEKVPSYARPLFIRQVMDMDTTGTFKMKKAELREQAYHLDQCPDPLFVLKPGSNEYEALDRAFYQQILAGTAGY